MTSVCAVEEDGKTCGRKTVGRGWCSKHWQRWKATGDPLGNPPKPAACIVQGQDGEACGKKVHGNGMCKMHYRRRQVNGDPLITQRPTRGKSVEFRWESKVDRNGPVPEYAPHLGQCWLWTGALDGGGYGLFRGEGYVRPHIWAYVRFVGAVPEGLQLDHLCRVRHCVNPAHLEAVTQRVNILRSTSPAAVNAAKTHCPQGHEYTPENTRYQKSGGRLCRECGREYERRKAQARTRAA